MGAARNVTNSFWWRPRVPEHYAITCNVLVDACENVTQLAQVLQSQTLAFLGSLQTLDLGQPAGGAAEPDARVPWKPADPRPRAAGRRTKATPSSDLCSRAARPTSAAE